MHVRIKKYLNTGYFEYPTLVAHQKEEDEKLKKEEENNQPKLTHSSTFLPEDKPPTPKFHSRVSKLQQANFFVSPKEIMPGIH